MSTARAELAYPCNCKAKYLDETSQREGQVM